MKRAQALDRGDVLPDQGALALAKIAATTIEDQDQLGLERGSDWVDELLDMMGLLARKASRR